MAEGTIDDVFIRLTAETSQLEQELAKARKKVDDYAKSVGIASDKTTASFKRISSAATPVQRAMRNVENAQRKLESITDITSQAYRDQAQAVAYLSAQLQNAQIKQTDMIKGQAGYALAATRGMGSTRAFGSAIQQAGYQVGDFAVQVASGQGFLRPFIQQGTQLVSMFGPTGAVIGAIGAIGGAVVTYFLAADTASEESKKSLEAYEGALKSLEDQVKENIKQQKILSGQWLGDVPDVMKKGVEEATKALADAQDEFEARRREADARTRGAGLGGLARGGLQVGPGPGAPEAYRFDAEGKKKIKDAQDKLNRSIKEYKLAVTNSVEADAKRMSVHESLIAQHDRLGTSFEDINFELKVYDELLKRGLTASEYSDQAAAVRVNMARARSIEDNIKATEEFDNAYQKSIDNAVELNRKRLDDEQEFAEATRTRISDLKDENQIRSEYIALLAQGKMKTDEFNDARKVESELKKSNLAVGSAAYNQLRDQLELERELIGLEKETVRSTGAFRAIEQTNKQTAATKALVKQYADGALTLEKYNEELEVQTALLGLSEEATQAERDALENSIRSRQAVTREFERVNEVAKLTEQVFNKAGDALADFAMTGKGDFKSLVDSMIADLIRYQIQQSMVKPLSGAFSSIGGFGGILGSLFGGPAAAMGGSGSYVIAAPGGSFAEGGHVNGPGTGTSDSIAANLSNGEFVINAQATKRNRALLEAINNGAVVQRFQSGGIVGGGAAAAANSNAPSVNIYDMRSNQSAPVETQTRTGSDGRREIAVMIRDTVNTGISSGVHDKAMSQRFGISPALTRRG